MSLETEAHRLSKLLHLYAGVKYHPKYKYAGARSRISKADIIRHLVGEITLAFCVCTKQVGNKEPLARFLAFDIDSNFDERGIILMRVLKRLGLVRAAFATLGSLPGRGKVVVAFRSMQPRWRARELGKLVLDEASLETDFGDWRQEDGVAIYPTWESGGLCRVLGASPRAGSTPEVPSIFDGTSDGMDLATIEPASTELVCKLVGMPDSGQKRPTLCLRAQNLLNMPWTYESFGSTRKLFSALIFLAREYLRVTGPSDGEQKFREALKHIKQISPDLCKPSPKTKDLRNPLDWSRSGRNAWNAALRQPTWWWAQEIVETDLLAQEVHCYRALCKFVAANGLNPHCFWISSRDLGAIAKMSHVSAQLWLRRLAVRGLLVILDRGKGSSPVRDSANRIIGVSPGLATMVGLICQGETEADVWASASRDPIFLSRQANTAELKAEGVCSDCDEISSPKTEVTKATGSERSGGSLVQGPWKNSAKAGDK